MDVKEVMRLSAEPLDYAAAMDPGHPRARAASYSFDHRLLAWMKVPLSMQSG